MFEKLSCRVTGFVVIFSNVKGRYKVFSLFLFFFWVVVQLSFE